MDEIKDYRAEDEKRLQELLLELRDAEIWGGEDMQSVLDSIGKKNGRRPFSCYGWRRGRSLSVEFPQTDAGWRAMKFLVEDLEARKKPKANPKLESTISVINSVLRSK